MKTPHFMGTFQQMRPRRIAKVHADIIDIRKAVRRTQTVPRQGLTPILVTNVIFGDFRKNESTIFNEYMQEFKKSGYKWKENETFIAISKNGKQAIFFVGETRVGPGGAFVVLDTRKWRLTQGGTWFNLANLVEYAAQAGFYLKIPSKKTVKEIIESEEDAAA